MPVGPRGEKRPVSPVSSMVKAMSIATGIEDEEYVDGAAGRPRAATDESSDDDEEEYELAALEIDASKTRKRKNWNKPKE